MRDKLSISILAIDNTLFIVNPRGFECTLLHKEMVQRHPLNPLIINKGQQGKRHSGDIGLFMKVSWGS